MGSVEGGFKLTQESNRKQNIIQRTVRNVHVTEKNLEIV